MLAGWICTIHVLCVLVTFFFLDLGMEKEQKQELGWRVVSVLPIPAFQHCEIRISSTQYTVECRNR